MVTKGIGGGLRPAGGWQFVWLMILLAALNSPQGHCEDAYLPRHTMPYGVHDIGGCKIISILASEEPSESVREWCKRLPVPSKVANRHWHDYYSSLEFILGSALEAAQESMDTIPSSILDKNTQIVVFGAPYPNAYIVKSDAEVVIFLNDGLIGLIESTIAGLRLEVERGQDAPFSEIVGVTFSEWLEQMRTPLEGYPATPTRVGPDPIQPEGFGEAFFWSNRIEATAVYQFIFGHELAHVRARDTVFDTNLQTESLRDLTALMAMSNTAIDGYFESASIAISSFMLAMWYYEQYWHQPTRQSSISQFQGWRTLLHTRNWKYRGEKILDRWITHTSQFDSRARLAQSAMKNLYGLRDPIVRNTFCRECLKGIEIIDSNVDFQRDPAIGTVKYRYTIRNNSEEAIDLIFEVQSRFFPREKNPIYSEYAPFDTSRMKPYGVADDMAHIMSLGSRENTTVAGTLHWYGNQEFYPGLTSRFVSIEKQAN